MVDDIGDEYLAREVAAKMANIDIKIEPVTISKKKKKILGLIPGGKIFEKFLGNILFEIDNSSRLLWLYKP